MNKRLIPLGLLLAYAILLIKVMVFKDLPTLRIGQLMLNFAGADGSHPPNFIPFTTIVPYLLGHKGWIIAGVNLVGNVALLVPVGLLLPLVDRNHGWKRALIVAFASGLAIETLQAALHVGVFDIDDVILNALGVILGYGAFLTFARWRRSRSWGKIAVASAALLALAAGALYAIYPHGQPVRPDIRVEHQAGEAIQERQEGGLDGEDPCRGTGGTGEIIAKEDGSMTIRSKAGVVQDIRISSRTDIKNSEGPLTESGLQVGQRVTVVIMEEGDAATAVLVCQP